MLNAISTAHSRPRTTWRVSNTCTALCLQVRGVYAVLLESKADRWQAQRTALIESIEDLAAFYRALQALPRSTSTADLSEWFEHLIDQVSCPLGMAP